tara:strand:+ start:223 stop:447 length:225 start_codon:yes stop_codon:yes gene_type:complete
MLSRILALFDNISIGLYLLEDAGASHYFSFALLKQGYLLAEMFHPIASLHDLYSLCHGLSGLLGDTVFPIACSQ